MAEVPPGPPYEAPCIVYKPLEADGGLERYVSTLAKTLEAPVYTRTQSVHPDHFGGVDIETFGRGRRDGTILGRFIPGSVAEVLSYENFTVPDRHDLVVTVGEPAKAVIQQPHQRRVHVLNMPPRWLFDLGPGRFEENGVRGSLKRLYQSAVRVHDISTLTRIDDFVVPSEVIERRLAAYYDREAAAVIHPPVQIDEYYHDEEGGYLLYLGRLTEAKRVVEIVEELSGTDYRLKVAGTGPLEDELERRAGQSVDLLGYVTEERKRELLANCDAVVFNSDREAFGIVPVEAFASGKPVVGIDEGYTQYQIEDGMNGILFERGGLVDAVETMYRRDWDPKTIHETASRYDVETFEQQWREYLTE